MITLITPELRKQIGNGILQEAYACDWTLAARTRNMFALANVPDGPLNVTLPDGDVDEDTCSDEILVQVQLDFLGLGG